MSKPSFINHCEIFFIAVIDNQNMDKTNKMKIKIKLGDGAISTNIYFEPAHLD